MVYEGTLQEKYIGSCTSQPVRPSGFLVQGKEGIGISESPVSSGRAPKFLQNQWVALCVSSFFLGDS